MPTNKPFYESRKRMFSCHTWNRPNYPLHIHKDIEFGYITYGEMKAKINGEEKILHAGDAMLILPYVLHSYESTGDVGFVLVIADMDYVGEFHNEISNLELPSPFFRKEDLSQIGQGALDLLTISSNNINARYESEKGMFMTLLSDIFCMIPTIKRKRPSEPNITEKMILYINDNIRNSIQAKDVARDLGISVYYISHIFSKELGISFSEYVSRQRLALAKDMIKDTHMSFTDISYETGFSNPRTFQRSFKQQFNMTATEWRKQCNEKASV